MSFGEWRGMSYLSRVITAAGPLYHRLTIAVALLSLVCATFAAPKTVRLRNEFIHTDKGQKKAGHEKGKVRNGMFVIQLTGPVEAGWLEQLKARGVTPLQYVPEHSYVARARGVRSDDLEELPFVQWTGDYRPDHKLHGKVGAAANKPGDDVDVSVLLAADATAQQLGAARGLLKKISSESTLRFGHVWRGRLGRGAVKALSESEAVLWIEPAPNIRMFDETATKIIGGDSGGHASYVQSLGYDGSGVTVAVADSGLYEGDAASMHPDLAGRVDAFFFYGQLTDASDEHGHGTHVAGIVAADGATGELDDYGALWGLGVAPGAHIVAQRLFDGDGGYEAPPSFLAMTSDAMGAGADIGSNSWGDDTQGRYDISAAEFDALVRDGDGSGRPYILEFSSGNAGPGQQTVGSPAVGKNVIATGASQNDRFDYYLYAEGQDSMADFSSRGPAEDGRIKPDLVAPGTWISSLRSSVGNDEFAWGDISFHYMFQGGTSQAGPHASGAAAVFVQYYRETQGGATPSPAMVKAALINSALDMYDESGTEPAPNMDEGWGRIDLTGLIDSGLVYEFVDQTVPLATGQQYERRVVIFDANEAFKVTLAYTDVPGFPGALPALVNDLDLEVIAPNGSVYRGNHFADGESMAGVPGNDAINNVEGVTIWEPAVGEYIVRVRARNVPQDSRIDTGAVDQDFALVVSGLVPPPGVGVVFLDRIAYTVPGTIKVSVVDTSLGVQPTINATISSATEPGGFVITLRNTGFAGAFTGSVVTATGPAANDGNLQVAHDDWIRVTYQDASEGMTRNAEATADLLPPSISGVTSGKRFANALITWTTDEPANSIVRFGTNAAMPFSIMNDEFVTLHEVELTNLISGRTYYYSVASFDIAGNGATNNNNGTLYSFVAPTNAPVLLVNAYTYSLEQESEFIPVNAYTDALELTGLPFDVLNVETASQSPNLARLAPYSVVIWRINDAFDSGDNISSSQQSVIQQYLAGGGSFFLSSMEIVSRLLNNNSAAFVTNVLHITRFIRNETLDVCPTCDEDRTVPYLEGVPQDPIGDGISATPDYTRYPDFFGLFGPDFGDTFGLKRDASPILIESSSGEPCGMRFPLTGQDSTGRVVFIAVPLDTLPESGSEGNVRATVLERSIQFLIPGARGVGTIAFDRGSYTVPAIATVEVADGDLAGSGQLLVNCSSDLSPSPVAVTLLETVRRGVFRGSVLLTNSAAPAAAGHLRASDGDQIYAAYVDASRGQTITATATIDTVKPLITGVTVEPDYENALVTWETDEFTDSLVEFGPSPLLGRTSYDDEPGDLHELRLDGLEPGKSYYFRVVSRDLAGNVAIDDNAGQLYTFSTLEPVALPFASMFDSGDDGWSVESGDESQVQWQLGVPNNGLENVAPSPPNAWGSSLNGDFSDYAETFLISPAISLAGGNSIKLRFTHSFDFSDASGSDLLQGGELLLFTNSYSAPISLAVYEDWTGGWLEEEIDLSLHSGRVVYLVFYYVLLSFEAAPRPGWLIDNVTISGSTILAGTLRVTNNLSQAAFSIEGPFTYRGSGVSFLNTNAPPGEYTVTFSNVAYFATPAPQTANLSQGAALTFTGNYTFTDANANSMSDEWEQANFGSVSPSRTQNSDTDLDGMTDYAEFIAGTLPNNPASTLRLLKPLPQSTGATRFEWPVVNGRRYRVHGSTNLQSWSALTEWTRANGTVLSHTMPAGSAIQFLRIEVSQ